jgi:hypothetical protein
LEFLEELTTGMTDKNLANFISSSCPSDFSGILFIASKFISDKERGSDTQEFGTRSGSSSRGPFEGDNRPRRDYSQRAVCYRCGDSSHFIGNCPQSDRRAVRVVNLDVTNKPSQDFVIRIADQEVPAFVDTGAEINALSAQWANQRSIVPTPVYGVLVKDAQGTFMPVIGTVELCISHEDHSSKDLFYIIDHLSKDVILGEPWCQKHRVTISYASGGRPEVTFGQINPNNSTNKSSTHGSRFSRHCVLESNVTIPAGQGCFVNVTINTDHDTVLVSKVQCLHPKRHYVTPRCILHVSKRKSQVFIINLCKNDIRFSKGSHLGKVEEILDINSISSISKDPSSNINCNESQKQSSTSFDISDEKYKHLSSDQSIRLKSLIDEYSDIFTQKGEPLSSTTNVRHKINTGDSVPIHCQPHRVSPQQASLIKEEVSKMLKDEIIEPSNSPWSAPVVIIKKADGTPRFCVDYRKLNAKTKLDVYPMPRIDATVDRLARAQYFSTLDLTSGYWQLEVEKEDIEKTAFTTTEDCFSSRGCRLDFATLRQHSSDLWIKFSGSYATKWR